MRRLLAIIRILAGRSGLEVSYGDDGMYLPVSGDVELVRQIANLFDYLKRTDALNR